MHNGTVLTTVCEINSYRSKFWQFFRLSVVFRNLKIDLSFKWRINFSLERARLFAVNTASSVCAGPSGMVAIFMTPLCSEMLAARRWTADYNTTTVKRFEFLAYHGSFICVSRYMHKRFKVCTVVFCESVEKNKDDMPRVRTMFVYILNKGWRYESCARQD